MILSSVFFLLSESFLKKTVTFQLEKPCEQVLKINGVGKKIKTENEKEY